MAQNEDHQNDEGWFYTEARGGQSGREGYRQRDERGPSHHQQQQQPAAQTVTRGRQNRKMQQIARRETDKPTQKDVDKPSKKTCL